MEFKNTKGMGGTKEEERKEEGEERRRGDEENRVEGAAAQPLASTAHGENRAEGHDPRPPAPTVVLRSAELSVGSEPGTGRPVSGPSVGLMEPSTATVRGRGSAERRSRSAIKPGPRSFKEALMGKKDDGIRNRSRSRNRKGEDDGKENRKRRREIGAGGRGSSHSRPADCDTADDMAVMDELGQSDDSDTDTVSGAPRPPAPRPSAEPEEEPSAASAHFSTASAPPERPRMATKVARGRGRPPTTGEYVGLAASKRELADAEERLLGLETEREVLKTGISRERRLRREGGASGERDPAASLPCQIGPEDVSRRSVADLDRGIAIASGAVDMVASRSKNLKGTFVRELREAARETREVFAEVKRRLQTTGDVPGLQHENAALRVEVERLREELRELRAVVGAMGMLGHVPLPVPTGPPSTASMSSVDARGGAGSADRGLPVSRMEGVDTSTTSQLPASPPADAHAILGDERGQRVCRPEEEGGSRRVLVRRIDRGGTRAPEKEEGGE